MTKSGQAPTEPWAQLYSTDLSIKTKNAAGEKSTKRIVFRIYIRQASDELSEVRFQISNDDELEYLFEVMYNKSGFDTMKDRQHLDLEFADFPNVVRQQIIAVLREVDLSEADRRYKVIFTEIDDRNPEDADDEYEGPGAEEENVPDGAPAADAEPRVTYFIIYEKLEFCRAQVFKFGFNRCTPDDTKTISQSRYDELTTKLKALETEYKDAYKRVQRTNPAILKGFKTDQAS
jgi:hypothetical protein